MKVLQLLPLLFLVALCTACPNAPSKSYDSAFISNTNKYLRLQQGRFNCALEEGKTYVPGSEACGAELDSSLDVAKRVRDDALEDALAIIDSNYNGFIANLDSRRSKMEFILDVIDLGAGAATGITKGERPNQILGIGITALRGGRRSAELSFYKQQTTPILIAKMDDNRSKIYANILRKKTETAINYRMKEAIRDIVAYYNAGTLIRAFAELTKDTAISASKSEELVRELKGDVQVSAIPTIKHENISTEVFARRLSLRKQLDAAITAANAIPIPPVAVAPAADNSAAIAAAKAARAAEFKDIRPKYDLVWKDIEAEAKFAPVIAELKTDADLTPIFAKLVADRNTVTGDEFDLLMTRFTAKVSRISKDTKSTELFEEFLKILRRADSQGE